MDIRFAEPNDLEYLQANDGYVRLEVLQDKIARGEIVVAVLDGRPVGWLRYGYFWDTVPFMNRLVVEEAHRGEGWGTRIIQFWERHLQERGYQWAMTSTQADERAQHLYRRLGYRDMGAMLWPEDPALEIFLLKQLTPDEGCVS
jgi:GNAT superfamily N-acetyltransferase